jgi:hypothetical protein
MRILRIPLGGLVFLGLAVALAVLVLGQGGARTAAAPPPEPHYKCYDIVGSNPPDVVQLVTQFGVQPDVAVGQATKLCLPAGKNDAPIPPGWPDLKCYNITGHDPDVTVNLETQFGKELGVDVGQALELCVPASMTADPPPTTPHYECYTITGSPPGATVKLETEFGVENGVVVGQPVRLCLPAGKNSPTIPEVPHLKCYTIDGPPPGQTVNLKTQFPIENGVIVGPATRLCVPADKVVWSAVGGIAELPDIAGVSADEAGASAGGSGWSTAGYAGLAGGLAAAVVFGAGAWYYARRRFSRS